MGGISSGEFVSGSGLAVYDGYARVRITYMYPLVAAEDVQYAPLRNALMAAKEQGAEHPLHEVWQALTPPWQDFLTRTTLPNQDESAGVANQLTERVIVSKRFEEMAAWNLAAIPGDFTELEKLDAPDVSPHKRVPTPHGPVRHPSPMAHVVSNSKEPLDSLE